MAVIIGAIVPTDSVTDDATIKLDTPWGSGLVAEIGGVTYVYTAGEVDDGLSVFTLDASGNLTNIQNISDAGLLELDGAQNVVTATVGGVTYLYVNAFFDDGISGFQVNPNGTLTNVVNVTDGGALELDGAEGRMAVASVGATQFLVAAGAADDGFSVFRIEANGTLTNTDNETDGSPNVLDGAEDVTTAVIGGSTFVFVAATGDDSVSVYQLDALGNATLRDSVVDTESVALQLDSAWGVATTSVEGVTYLIASGNADDGLSVFSVSGAGILTNVFNVEDSATLGLNGARSLSTFRLDGEAFVAVAGEDDDAVTIFHVGAGGVLTDVATILDNVALELGQAVSAYLGLVAGRPFLTGVGRTDDGISVFDFGGGDDLLTGTAVADVLLGLGGNDVLDGGDGADRMIGGSGDDVFLVSEAGDEVVERLDGGVDTVRSAISYKLGTHVERLKLLAGATDGTGNKFDNVLKGNGAANELKGLRGDDKLVGRGGADDLLGQDGVDRILGGAGGDDITGGRGRDLVKGQGGADDFIYKSTRDSGPGVLARDRILDFRGQDDIVLTRVDADATVAGNQNFTFDTDGVFETGEIRFFQVGANVMVEMNTDADAAAEMSILLVGFTGVLDNSDFVV